MPVTTQAYPSSTILETIRLRLRNGLVINDHYVRLTAADDYKVTFEEKFIAIRPLGPIPFVDAGGGRRARPVKRFIRVYLHLRSSIDFVGDDGIVMPEMFDFEDAVFNLLDDWFVTNANGVVLTHEPIHTADASAGPPTRQVLNDVGEVVSRLDFEVPYILVNNTPAP